MLKWSRFITSYLEYSWYKNYVIWLRQSIFDLTQWKTYKAIFYVSWIHSYMKKLNWFINFPRYGICACKKTNNTNFYLTTDPEKVTKMFLEKLFLVIFGHFGSILPIHFFFFGGKDGGGSKGRFLRQRRLYRNFRLWRSKMALKEERWSEE